MKNLLTSISFLILLTFAGSILSAQEHRAFNLHVAVDGSDESGDGTPNHPFASITEASKHVQPGDTVFVHQGTYHNQHFDNGDIWTKEDLAKITCHGTEDAYIVFMPYPGDTVLLEYDASHGVLINKSSYVIFSGFDIKGIGDRITKEEAEDAWGLYKDSLGVIHDLAQEMGIDITDPDLLGQTLEKPVTNNIQKPTYYNNTALSARLSHHIIMENNTVRWATASGLRVQRSDYTIVRNNKIFYNTYRTSAGVGALTVAESTVIPDGDTFDGIKIKIINNEVHNNENQIYSWAPAKSFIHFVIDEGSGIFFTRNHDTYDHGYSLVANNLSWQNGASGIVIHKTDRVIVEHNTVYDNGTTNGETAKPGGIGFNTTDHVTIRNNISWSKPNKFALGKVGGNNTNMVIDSNLLFNNNGPQQVVNNVSGGWFEANPQFVNVDDFDFHLSKNSPAIDRGDTAAIVTIDFSYYPRNDGKPDIGAYEYDPTTSTAAFFKNNNELLTAYPNPANNIIKVRLKDNGFNTLRLFSLSGNEFPVQSTIANRNEVLVDLSNLASGIYILRSKDASVKILKQ